MKTIVNVAITALLVLLFMSVAANATQRLVLAEMFTNTSCGPCYNANLTLDQLADNHPDEFVAIRYHVWWPSEYDPFYTFNPSENGIRTNYYGVNSVPHLQVDGIIDAGGYSQYWSRIQSRLNVDSPLEIGLSGTFDEDSGEGTIDVVITATDEIAPEGLFLRIALTESNIIWNAPNGLNEHDQTMRYMVPYSTGIYIEIDNGEVVEQSQTFYCPLPLVPENCELAVWVQSDQTREVLQAARISVPELGPVSIEEEINLPGKLKLAQNYPNPFNASTVIEYVIEHESYVEITIFDLGGREISTIVDNVQPAGDHQAIWNGTDSNGNTVSSGVYFYRLTAGDKSLTKRMTLLK